VTFIEFMEKLYGSLN